MTFPTDQRSATAAEAAGILGVTRGRVLELAASVPDFPPAESTAGGRVWPRAAIEAWAAAHPDRGPRHTGLEVPSVGGWPPQVERVASLAAAEARALHHGWVGQDHLLLALLYPDCPGAAPAVLASFGVTAQPLREAFVASMGDPHEADQRGTSWSPAAQLAVGACQRGSGRARRRRGRKRACAVGVDQPVGWELCHRLAGAARDRSASGAPAGGRPHRGGGSA